MKWIFQGKPLEISKLNSLTLSITSKASTLMRMGSNSCWDFVKDNRIFLKIYRSAGLYFEMTIVLRWALLSSPFATVSDIDAFVSSTYFHKRAFSATSRVFPYAEISVRDTLFRRKRKKGRKAPKRIGPLGRNIF